MLQNREWEQVYKLFKYDSTPGDTAYIINLARPGQWVPTHFYAQKFYYRDRTERHVRLKGKGSIMDDYQKIRSGEQRGNIYFVFLTGYHRLQKSYFENYKNIIFHPYVKVCVVCLLNNENVSETILDFFYCLADHLPKRKYCYIVYETLFNLELANGRLMKAKKHLGTLVKFGTRGKLKVKIKEFHRRWQSKVKRREQIIAKRKGKRIKK